MPELNPILRGLLTFLIAAVAMLNERLKTPASLKPYVALAVALVVTWGLGLVGVIPQGESYAQGLLLAGLIFTGYTLAKPGENLQSFAIAPVAVATAAVGGFGAYMGVTNPAGSPFWIDPVLSILAGIFARLWGNRKST